MGTQIFMLHRVHESFLSAVKLLTEQFSRLIFSLALLSVRIMVAGYRRLCFFFY